MEQILVVEDDRNNAQVFEALLRRIGGFAVIVSENVPEILSACRSDRVDLVIMDISLSRSYYEGRKLDGLGITRLLKADPATRRIPVVLATAHAMRGDKERFLSESGADGYVSKPVVNPREFVAEIRRMIRESKTQEVK